MSSRRLRLVAAMTRMLTVARDPIGADLLQLAGLEEAQQQALHAQRHLADFVEEQRAAVGHFELALLVAIGAGEAALHVAEELRLEQRLGQAGAVDGHERPWRRARCARGPPGRPVPCPTPLSPVMSTLASDRAVRSMSTRRSATAGLSPISCASTVAASIGSSSNRPSGMSLIVAGPSTGQPGLRQQDNMSGPATPSARSTPLLIARLFKFWPRDNIVQDSGRSWVER